MASNPFAQKRKRLSKMFREQSMIDDIAMRMKNVSKSSDGKFITAFKELIKDVAAEVKNGLGSIGEAKF